MAVGNSFETNTLDSGLYWKCMRCLYENSADLMTCKICKRTPSEETEYLTLAEWKQKMSRTCSEHQCERQESEKHTHYSGNFENDGISKNSKRCEGNVSDYDSETNGIQDEINLIKRLCQRHYDLNKKTAEIVAKLLVRNHDEMVAVNAVIQHGTFEAALAACNKYKERQKRVIELITENIFTNIEEAELAATLMDLGHDRIMSIRAVKACKSLPQAQKFIDEHVLIGIRCFSKSKLKNLLDGLTSEGCRLPMSKLEIAGKLMLIGHNKETAIRAAMMFDTLDQAKKLCMEQLEFKKRVEDMVSEEILPNEDKAGVAIQLMDLKYSKKHAVLAAKRCSNLDDAKMYLQTECTICLDVFPQCDMITMLYCHHFCCRHCTKTHFTVSIREKAITQILCPVCNEPNLDNHQHVSNYFNYLSELLKKVIDDNVYEILQNKLEDFILANNPGFLCCPACHDRSKFNVDPQGRRLECPRCKCKICAQCKIEWDDYHEGKSCKEFALWNRIERGKQHKDDLETYLKHFLITCPQCNFQYELVRGGCMHLKCRQCNHEFCVSCKKPYLVGSKCTKTEACIHLGLHAHHPRDCFYYWRDEEVTHLKKLLDEEEIIYDENEIREFQGMSLTCPMKEERDYGGGSSKNVCGKLVEEGQAGLCKNHYNEYLIYLVVKHGLDPAQVMSYKDLKNEIRRHQKEIPKQHKDESEEEYLHKLRKFVILHIPLYG